MNMSKYNVDALIIDRKAGTYRQAGARFIEGALECGHTAHIQTDLGIVAFRPYNIDMVRINNRTGEDQFPGEVKGQNWLLEFYPTGHKHGDEITMRSTNKMDLIRFAYGLLNGEQKATVESGDSRPVYANQAQREGWILAVIGEQVLIEYEMPGTTAQYAHHPATPWSALRIVNMIGTMEYGDYKSVTHAKLPKRWVTAMHDQGIDDWIGAGQREITPVPFPNKYL